MTTEQDIKEWIESSLPDSTVWIEGDGRHFRARVISGSFSGKNSVERHRMVYAALGDKMKEQIHALSLETLAPEEQS